MAAQVRMYCGDDSREWYPMELEYLELEPSVLATMKTVELIETRRTRVTGEYVPAEHETRPAPWPPMPLVVGGFMAPVIMPQQTTHVRRAARFPKGREDSFALVRRFEFTDCTDPRDRVYALMALDRPSHFALQTFLFPSDAYTRPPHQLFVDVCVLEFASSWKTRQHSHQANIDDIMTLFRALRLNRSNVGEILDAMCAGFDKLSEFRHYFKAVVAAFDVNGMLAATKGAPCDIFLGEDPQQMPQELVYHGVQLLRQRQRTMQTVARGRALLMWVPSIMRRHFLG
jgi:hypothetical protein